MAHRQEERRESGVPGMELRAARQEPAALRLISPDGFNMIIKWSKNRLEPQPATTALNNNKSDYNNTLSHIYLYF